MASLVKVIQLHLQMKPYSMKESGRCTEEDKTDDTSWLMEIFATVEALFHTTDMQQKVLKCVRVCQHELSVSICAQGK